MSVYCTVIKEKIVRKLFSDIVANRTANPAMARKTIFRVDAFPDFSPKINALPMLRNKRILTARKASTNPKPSREVARANSDSLRKDPVLGQERYWRYPTN